MFREEVADTSVLADETAGFGIARRVLSASGGSTSYGPLSAAKKLRICEIESSGAHPVRIRAAVQISAPARTPKRTIAHAPVLLSVLTVLCRGTKVDDIHGRFLARADRSRVQ